MTDVALAVQDYDALRRRGILVTLLILLSFIVLLLVGLWYRVQQTATLKVEDLSELGAVIFETPRKIRPLQLQNQQGDLVTHDFLQGKWSVLFYGFTHCPDICPATLRELTQVEAQLSARGSQAHWQAVMVAVDHERDKPAVLAPYLRYFSPDFHGVTGNETQLRQLAADTNSAFGKVYHADGTYTMDHSSQLVLINPKGDYAGFIKGPIQASRVAPVLLSLIADFDQRYQ